LRNNGRASFYDLHFSVYVLLENVALHKSIAVTVTVIKLKEWYTNCIFSVHLVHLHSYHSTVQL